MTRAGVIFLAKALMDEGCQRSHPHDEMNRDCQYKTIIAEQRSRIAALEEESRQWDKTSLVAMLKQTEEQRALIEQQAKEIARFKQLCRDVMMSCGWYIRRNDMILFDEIKTALSEKKEEHP